MLLSHAHLFRNIEEQLRLSSTGHESSASSAFWTFNTYHQPHSHHSHPHQTPALHPESTLLSSSASQFLDHQPQSLTTVEYKYLSASAVGFPVALVCRSSRPAWWADRSICPRYAVDSAG